MKRLLQRANSFIKDLLLVSRIGILFAPLRHLLRFTLNFSLMSSWVNKNRGIPFTDYYRPFRKYTDREKLHRHVIRQERLDERPIHYFEFGVAGGHSFRWWLDACKHENSRFFGFDTFEGLPEDWHFFKKGDMAYGVPSLQDPRARFVKGIFQDTLLPFLEEYRGLKGGVAGAGDLLRVYPPVTRVLHMDADLYSSTLFALTAMAPYLHAGDVILFDEFNVPNHEFAAWEQFSRCYYVRYEVMGSVNNFYQTAIKILR